ncbi:unnamed protein product [Spirodela intermedia]|uniref:Uncharacterized protein n=1 Tax=Spirodela intermedia TaxID=51605 RepID=A0A7I8IL80_SPIIN|nr:unnamed protein product [Spirodela intermedia]CAA6658163.1 unnamed protein product [Spirodela intermedia]
MIALSLFSCVYDYSLPHNRLATSDVEEEWCIRILTMSLLSLSLAVSMPYSYWVSDVKEEKVINQALIFLIFPLASYY